MEICNELYEEYTDMMSRSYTDTMSRSPADDDDLCYKTYFQVRHADSCQCRCYRIII